MTCWLHFGYILLAINQFSCRNGLTKMFSFLINNLLVRCYNKNEYIVFMDDFKHKMTYEQHTAYIILQFCITHLDATFLFAVLFFITITSPCIACMPYFIYSIMYLSIFVKYSFYLIVDLIHNIKYSLK